MFKGFPRAWRWYLPFLWIPVSAAAVVALWQVPWPTTLADWQGTKAPIEVLANVVTPITALVAVIGLIINGRSANRTLEHARNSQLISTFQKAAELLATYTDTARAAGLSLIQQTALQNPDALAEPAIRVVRYSIAEATEAMWQKSREMLRTGSLPVRKFDYPSTPHAAMFALDVLSRVAPKWPGGLVENMAMANAMLFSAGTFYNINWQGLWLRRVLFTDPIFEGARMERLRINGFVGERVEFYRCTLRNVAIYLSDVDEGRLVEGSKQVLFTECDFDEQSTINDVPIGRWITNSPGS